MAKHMLPAYCIKVVFVYVSSRLPRGWCGSCFCVARKTVEGLGNINEE